MPLWGALLWQVEKSDLYPRGWGELAYYGLPSLETPYPAANGQPWYVPCGTMTERVDAGRREHGNKSRVKSGGIFDPTLSSLFSVRLYLRIPLQETQWSTISQPEAIFPQSFSAGFDAGNGRRQTSSPQAPLSILPFFIFVPDIVLKVGRYSIPRGGPYWKQQSHAAQQ